MKTRGTLKFFLPKRSFGFVHPDDGSPDLYLGGADVDGMELKGGDIIAFDEGVGPDGRPRAVNIELIRSGE